MKVSNITWKIGGEAGFGIMSTGTIFSKIFAKKGYYVVDNNEYPSLIRGGHNTFTVRVSSNEIFSVDKEINILVALNEETIRLHQEEVTYGGYIIYDENNGGIGEIKKARKDINYIMVPFSKIIAELGVPPVMTNNVSLGASVALLNYDLEVLRNIIRDIFERKGPEVVNSNINHPNLDINI